jgi:hypothetical protein
VPYEDIEEFLRVNKKSYLNENDAYNKASILLKDRNAIGHTISIVEWMIAHNLIKNKVNIPNFTIYQIDNMHEFEIAELARLLTMNGNNEEHIKNILNYMNKLSILPEHPDVKPLILDTILEFKILSSDLHIVMNIFENNKFLRKFIYDNMGKIITNNIKFDEKGKIVQDSAHQLADFIFDFMIANEFILAKEALKFASKYDFKLSRSKILFNLTYNVLMSLNTNLIVKYFELSEYINSLYNETGDINYIIKGALLSPLGEFKDNQRKYLPSIFQAALITDKIEILKPIYHFWYFESDYTVKYKKYNIKFLKEMDPLIKQFEQKYPELKYNL